MADTYYAIVDKQTGQLRSTGSVVADPAELAASGLEALVLDTPPVPGDKRWNPASRKFDLPMTGAVGFPDLLAADAEFGTLPKGTRDQVVAIARRIADGRAAS